VRRALTRIDGPLFPEGDGPPSGRFGRSVDAVAPGAAGGAWRPLKGGRTNRLWRVVRAGAPTVVVKVYALAGTPVFPNLPRAEAAALRRLCGTGLAPRLLGGERACGVRFLVYEHVRAEGPADPESAARALRGLHGLPPPRGLRRLPPLRDMLAELVRDLGEVPAPIRAAMGACGPEGPVTFLHGDPTPGNALAAPGGCVLVDWQCPAIGDPSWDLAILLSPAMRHLDGLPPLDAGEERAVLRAYGSDARRRRLASGRRALRALIAAHCLWRARRGWSGAARAAELELDAMG
jgi:hypothetical protein